MLAVMLPTDAGAVTLTLPPSQSIYHPLLQLTLCYFLFIIYFFGLGQHYRLLLAASCQHSLLFLIASKDGPLQALL